MGSHLSFDFEEHNDWRAVKGVHPSTIKGHPMQLAGAKIFKESMLQKLKPWIAEHCAIQKSIAMTSL